MMQVDPLLAFGMSSVLGLSKAPAPGRPWVPTLLWLSLAFAPQAVYLLWRFPGWETMFLFGGDRPVPPWLAAALPASMVAAGAGGLGLARSLVRRGRRGWAVAATAAAFAGSALVVTVGWDGTGYRRFLYPGTAAEWAQGQRYGLGELLHSELAATLPFVLVLVVVPWALLWLGLRRAPAQVRP